MNNPIVWLVVNVVMFAIGMRLAVEAEASIVRRIDIRQSKTVTAVVPIRRSSLCLGLRVQLIVASVPH